MTVFSVRSAYASDNGIGRITLIEGRAEILRASGEVILARRLESVQVGDRVRTKNYSKAEIHFLDKSVLRLAPNTCVEITEYKLGSRKRREMGKITLTRGKVRAVVSKTGPPDTFNILTPNACGTVKGSDIFVTYLSGRTGILVREGSLFLSNILIPTPPIKVTAGDTAAVSFQKPPSELRPYFDVELRRYEKDVRPTVMPAGARARREVAQMHGTVVSVSGKARLFKSGSSSWHYLKPNEAISKGDTILTEEDGIIEMRLDNGDAIWLQPDTELVFASLRRDPGTGKDINTFESSKGRIKAIIETGKKSTFQVRTPTAVCGVRGTVMIIDIQPSGTTAYYEGGGGIMTSLVTGESTLIESGQNSSIDAKGVVSLPVYTTDDQRAGLSESYGMTPLGKELSTQTSDPGTAKVSLPGESETGVTSFQSVRTEKQESILQGLFNTMMLSELLPPPQPPEEAVSGTSFSGTFGYVGVVSNRAVLAGSTGSLNAEFNFAFDSPTWDLETIGTLSGTYSSKPSGYDLFSADLKCTADDSGRYMGFLRGLMLDGVSRMAVACIYVDPSNRGGTLSADMSGTYTSSTITASDIDGVIVTKQDLLNFPRENLFSTSMQSLELTGRGIGDFNDWTGAGIVCGSIGTMDGFSGSTLNMVGYNWGICEFSSQGTLTAGATGDTWKLALGGESQFINPDESFWIALVNGQEGTNGRLYGFFDGVWLSKTNHSDDGVSAGPLPEGTFIGDYDDVGRTWEAVGTAEWSQQTAQFTQANLGFTISQLGTFVNYPIYEHDARGLSLAGGSDASFASASTVVRLFDNADALGINVWTAVLEGTFSGSGPATPNSWTLNLSDGANTLTLTGDDWSNNAWHAIASGNVAGHAVVKGEAGGIYSTSSNDIEGIAVGTYTP
jgi:hypothetical protein